MTIKTWMIYGAYGYTGELIVAEAVKRGHMPVIAGRNEARLLNIADKYGLSYRVFAAEDHRQIKNHLEGVGLVLNCAGPFSQTATPIRTACLGKPCHYLDITGEIDVLEASYQAHDDARKAGCVVISGVGFDVMPTDFLAYLLKQKLPSATHLELAFCGSGGVSPGTAKTMIEMLVGKGRVREEGELRQVPLAYESKNIAFSDKEHFCTTIPWGDVCTAYYSTDIPNIRVYTAVEENQVKWMKRINPLVKLLDIPFIQKQLKALITHYVKGPTQPQRDSGFMRLWGKATDGKDDVSLCMDTSEGYNFTVISSLMAVEALLAHKIMPGAYTPSQAFPMEVILGMEGVKIMSDDINVIYSELSGETMKNQLEVMLELQDKMNKKVHPEWVAQNFAWFRAIWIECGELVDHYGYKWWKKQVPDMQQVQLEVVDIWHFGLSMLIDGRDFSDIADDILLHLQGESVEQAGVIDATESLAESILATRKFDVSKFRALLLACDMSFDELFKQYVGKNVLNFFRQDHGYKEGSYIKQWHGREDNEYLSDVLNMIKPVDNDFAEKVYKALEEHYRLVAP